MQLRDSVVLVTGASSGIGAATAVAVARRGASVVLLARRRAQLEAVAARIARDGGRCAVVAGSVTEAAVVDEAVQKAGSLGALGAVVHAAGELGPRVPLTAYPEEAFRAVVETNATGTFLVLRATLPVLVARSHGAVVLVSSYLGRHALPDCAGYVASKFALEGLARAAAVEVQGRGVAVVSLSPGMVATPMLRAYLRGEDPSPYTPPERVGEAIARLLVDLGPADNGRALDIDPWLALVDPEETTR